MSKKQLQKVVKTNYAIGRVESYLNEALYYASSEKDTKIYERLKKIKTELVNIRIDHTIKMNKLKEQHENQ